MKGWITNEIYYHKILDADLYNNPPSTVKEFEELILNSAIQVDMRALVDKGQNEISKYAARLQRYYSRPSARKCGNRRTIILNKFY